MLLCIVVLYTQGKNSLHRDELMEDIGSSVPTGDQWTVEKVQSCKSGESQELGSGLPKMGLARGTASFWPSYQLTEGFVCPA